MLRPVAFVAMVDALAVALAYLAGSVSFPYWIARAHGIDLARTGTRKLGGSNLARTLTPLHGLLGGLLDGAKGFLAVQVAGQAGLASETALLAGLAAVIGQIWPLWHRFDGGRAIATGWGFTLAADPLAFVIGMIPVLWALPFRLVLRPRPRRLLPLAALLSFAVFPAVIWEQQGATPTVLAGLGLLALVLVRRLSAGLREDLATGAPPLRIALNRALFDRSELQERGVVPI